MIDIKERDILPFTIVSENVMGNSILTTKNVIVIDVNPKVPVVCDIGENSIIYNLNIIFIKNNCIIGKFKSNTAFICALNKNEDGVLIEDDVEDGANIIRISRINRKDVES